MALRRLALIGAAEGPWVDVSRVASPKLRITGLQEGTVSATICYADGETRVIHLYANGVHDLPGEAPVTCVRISCSAARPHQTICEIVARKAAA